MAAQGALIFSGNQGTQFSLTVSCINTFGESSSVTILIWAFPYVTTNVPWDGPNHPFAPINPLRNAGGTISGLATNDGCVSGCQIWSFGSNNYPALPPNDPGSYYIYNYVSLQLQSLEFSGNCIHTNRNQPLYLDSCTSPIGGPGCVQWTFQYNGVNNGFWWSVSDAGYSMNSGLNGYKIQSWLGASISDPNAVWINVNL